MFRWRRADYGGRYHRSFALAPCDFPLQASHGQLLPKHRDKDSESTCGGCHRNSGPSPETGGRHHVFVREKTNTCFIFVSRLTGLPANQQITHTHTQSEEAGSSTNRTKQFCPERKSSGETKKTHTHTWNRQNKESVCV